MTTQTPPKALQLSYPQNISKIDHASFLHIKRWSYDQAQKEVMKDQADASGLIRNSGAYKPAEGIENWLAENSGLDVVSGNDAGSTETKIRNLLRKEMVDEANGVWEDAAIRQKVDGDWSWDRDAEVRQARLDAESFIKNISADQINERLAGTEWAQDALNAEKEREEEFARAQAGLVNMIKGKSDYCNLALPNEFQYGYGADWSNTFKLGTLALIAENPARGATIAAGAATASTVTNLAGAFASGTTGGNLGAAFAAGLKTAIDPFNVGTKITPTNIAGLAGLAPNENAMQFFKKMDFRQFDLNFQLAARNATESNMIEQIIQWFKVAMHPGTLNSSGSSALLSFPDVFEIIPQFVAAKFAPTTSGVQFRPVRHPMMPKTKLCALTNLKVNTTPMAQLTTIFDGSIPLITMTLTFTELTALTKADFGLGQMEVPQIGQAGTSKEEFNQRKQNDFYNY